MENRVALTDEELGFECGTKLFLANAFVAVLFGWMAWVPASLLYTATQVAVPGLPTGGGAIGLITAVCLGVAQVWAFVAAERFRDVSFRFNRTYLKVYRDKIVRTHILWEDVESVRLGAPYVVRTRQGTVVEIPFGALMSERFDNRSLKNQLESFQKPAAEPSPKKFGWFGLTGTLIGVPLLMASKRPPDVFRDAQGLSSSVWLQLLPFVIGAVGTVTGVLCLLIWLSLVTERKKAHPYRVATEGIWEGQKLTPWADVDRITRLGPKNMQIQIAFQKGSRQIIDCEKYLDGEDLREAILFMAPPQAVQQPTMGLGLLPGQTLISKSWTTQMDTLGCLGLVAIGAAVLSLAAISGLLGDPRRSDALGMGVLSFLLFVLLGGVMMLACYRVELNDTEVRLKRVLFPAKVILLDDIQSVEVRCLRAKDGPLDVMTLRSRDRSIGISSRLEKYGEFRDAIQCRVPADRIRYS